MTSQVIAFFACVLFIYLATGGVGADTVSGFLLAMLGLGFCNIWTYLEIYPAWIVGEWFTTVIIFLYLIFPLMRKLFMQYRLLASFIIYVMCILNMEFQILSAADGCFSYSNGIALFWTGMLFNEYKDVLLKSKIFSFYIPILVVGILVFFFPLYRIGGFTYIYIYVYSIFLYILLYNVKYSSFVTRFICKYNFELYLMHHRIYIILKPCVISSHGSLFQLICIFVFMNFIVFYVSFYIKKIADTISSMLLRRRNCGYSSAEVQKIC